MDPGTLTVTVAYAQFLEYLNQSERIKNQAAQLRAMGTETAHQRQTIENLRQCLRAERAAVLTLTQERDEARAAGGDSSLLKTERDEARKQRDRAYAERDCNLRNYTTERAVADTAMKDRDSARKERDTIAKARNIDHAFHINREMCLTRDLNSANNLLDSLRRALGVR